jgi:hypothetical protein
MRISLLVILLLALVISGCARKIHADQPVPAQPRAGSPAAATSASATNQTLIVTPENALIGNVALVNTTARFVVLNFPLGKMAAVEQHLYLYRRGLKVGEVKVTGPAREGNIVADLVAGEAEVGDDARSQ